MDARTEVQQEDHKINLGFHAWDYIGAAQKFLDSGNINKCFMYLVSGIEAGAEPRHLLKTAHTNALNGAKKLMANPSAKKGANLRKNSIAGDTKPSKNGQQYSHTIHLEPSRLSKSLKRFKNLGAPVRPIKKTPKTSTTQKISLKKLEESPMSMRYLDAPSPLPPYHLANQVKLDQPPFTDRLVGTQISPMKDAVVNTENKQSSLNASSLPVEPLRENDNLPLNKKESLRGGRLDEQCSLFCGKENRNLAFTSMTDTGVHVKKCDIFDLYGSKSSSRTMQPCSSHKSFLGESPGGSKQLLGQNGRCNSTALEGPCDASSYENKTSAGAFRKKQDSLESTETFTTQGSLSDCWTGTSFTDQNFLSERLSSDSGYLEVVSSGFAQMNRALSSCKKGSVNEKSAKEQIQHCELQRDGILDVDCGGNLAANRNLQYNDNTPASEKYACKVDKLMTLYEHETTGQNSVTENAQEDSKVNQFPCAVRDRISESIESDANLMRNQGVDKSFEEKGINVVPCQKLNLSGVAELSNLSLSDDKQIPSTSSRSLLSTSSTGTLSVTSKSTSSVTIKNSPARDAVTVGASGMSGQPFKIPAVPNPYDCIKRFSRDCPESHQSDYCSSSQRTLGISDYLVKKRKDAEAARVKSQSTTKKHKMLRIKKERYRVLSTLGKGGSSKVYEVENDDGKIFAMKCVPLEDLDDIVFYSHCNEIDILWALRNDQYIIKLYEYELKNEKLFMLMEKGEMDLEKYLHLNRQMECEKIRDLWTQMLCAVNSIHKQGIIHTDLKPANFLFVDSTLKLIDFGIAKGLKENCTSTQRECLIGTLNYMAPESVSESTKRTEYGSPKKNYEIRRATDIWSLGCILYLMVYGKTPFQHIRPKALKVAAITDGSQIAFPDIENDDLLDTIKGCLRRSPSQRYTIEQLLAHPFVSKGASQDLAKDSGDGDSHKKKENRLFLQHVKESAIRSPNSLDRAQKVLARRKLMEDNDAYEVGKPIY